MLAVTFGRLVYDDTEIVVALRTGSRNVFSNRNESHIANTVRTQAWVGRRERERQRMPHCLCGERSCSGLASNKIWVRSSTSGMSRDDVSMSRRSSFATIAAFNLGWPELRLGALVGMSDGSV